MKTERMWQVALWCLAILTLAYAAQVWHGITRPANRFTVAIDSGGRPFRLDAQTGRIWFLDSKDAQTERLAFHEVYDKEVRWFLDGTDRLRDEIRRQAGKGGAP